MMCFNKIQERQDCILFYFKSYKPEKDKVSYNTCFKVREMVILMLAVSHDFFVCFIISVYII